CGIAGDVTVHGDRVDGQPSSLRTLAAASSLTVHRFLDVEMDARVRSANAGRAFAFWLAFTWKAGGGAREVRRR
ncbi:MAG: hypothetical protein ACREH4_10080, partial [Vitreimonas sp.]